MAGAAIVAATAVTARAVLTKSRRVRSLSGVIFKEATSRIRRIRFNCIMPKSGAGAPMYPKRSGGVAMPDQPIVERTEYRGWTNCWRSEEHTSELQSLRHLVCRLLLE